VDIDTKGGNVLLLEFTSQVALDKGGLHQDSSLVYRALHVLSPRRGHLLSGKRGSCIASAPSATATATASVQNNELTEADGLDIKTNLSGTTITNKHELESGNLFRSSHICDSQSFRRGKTDENKRGTAV